MTYFYQQSAATIFMVCSPGFALNLGECSIGYGKSFVELIGRKKGKVLLIGGKEFQL
jgi:hypothetical protein